MKKIWVFLLGILSGVILTFLTLIVIAGIKTNNSNPKFFDEPGDIISERAMNVFQVLDDGAALATGQYDILSVYLLYDEDGKPFYDNQEVIAPKGKCFRQVGIYKYKANNGMLKTVPVVKLMDGESEIDDKETEVGLNSFFSGLSGEVSLFDEPSETMSNKSFKVDKVLREGFAIARGKDELGFWYGLEVALCDTSAHFYDDQIVKLPAGMRFRQIGTYKDYIHTYPIVMAMK